MSETPSPGSQVSIYLHALAQGDESAIPQLLPHIYDDLKRLANRVGGGSGPRTLQPTALVHEAYIRLVGSEQAQYSDRLHFMRVAAMAMRQLLTSYARARRTAKRGGEREQVVLDSSAPVASDNESVDLVALDEALTKLRELNERQARVVELRHLVGLSVEETADVLGVSTRTVKLDWQLARRWLSQALSDE